MMKVMKWFFYALFGTGLIACTQPKKAAEILTEQGEYESAPHFIITTNAATYYYDMQGGGFSRIIDKDGNDWVSFKKEPWGIYPASAASSYRGLPNCVFQGDDDGAGHPGHKKCVSRLDGKKIVTESHSGKWQWCWEFFDDHAVLNIMKTDTSRNYWFLYEGTPGGEFNPEESYFGTSKSGPITDQYDYYKGELYHDQIQWMYAGHQNADRVFYMAQMQNDEHNDFIGFLGNTEAGIESEDGMTVFAFGRSADTRSLLKGAQKFVIGFYPEKIADSEKHIKFARFISKKYETIWTD